MIVPRLPLLAVALLPLAACVSTTMPRVAEECQREPAQVLVGQRASSETGARALRLTGARTLRWGPPGAVFTMDYRTDRVSVMYDEAMAITAVRCG
jgi:hypothetical protein